MLISHPPLSHPLLNANLILLSPRRAIVFERHRALLLGPERLALIHPALAVRRVRVVVAAARVRWRIRHLPCALIVECTTLFAAPSTAVRYLISFFTTPETAVRYVITLFAAPETAVRYRIIAIIARYRISSFIVSV